MTFLTGYFSRLAFKIFKDKNTFEFLLRISLKKIQNRKIKCFFVVRLCWVRLQVTDGQN